CAPVDARGGSNLRPPALHPDRRRRTLPAACGSRGKAKAGLLAPALSREDGGAGGSAIANQPGRFRLVGKRASKVGKRAALMLNCYTLHPTEDQQCPTTSSKPASAAPPAPAAAPPMRSPA